MITSERTNPSSRFYDTEVPVAVVRIHAPGVEPRSGGRQQDLTGELIDRVVDALPAQPRRQPVPCRAVQIPFGRRERLADAADRGFIPTRSPSPWVRLLAWVFTYAAAVVVDTGATRRTPQSSPASSESRAWWDPRLAAVLYIPDTWSRSTAPRDA